MSELAQRIGAMSATQRTQLRDLIRVKPPLETAAAAPGMDFSILFFSGDGETAGNDKYDLMLESASFADERGFSAVWVPERHFSRFGGLYPNPSVLAAALAMRTKRLRLRAGSVVLPLHNPLRVAEEWSVVDNLSHGRVELSVASGWSPHDFAIAPDAYADRRALLRQRLDEVCRLWQGEALEQRDGLGQLRAVRSLPRPIQPRLPVWLTSTHDPETWRHAGALGAGVLTALIRLDRDELAERVQLYRASLREHGYPESSARVAVMLHTFVTDTDEEARDRARGPLLEYLGAFLDGAAEGPSGAGRRALAEFAYERYFRSGSLLGSKGKCAALLRDLAAAGCTEAACLVDFGLSTREVLESLARVADLREKITTRAA